VSTTLVINTPSPPSHSLGVRLSGRGLFVVAIRLNLPCQRRDQHCYREDRPPPETCAMTTVMARDSNEGVRQWFCKLEQRIAADPTGDQECDRDSRPASTESTW
jgi:hypothetical protein